MDNLCLAAFAFFLVGVFVGAGVSTLLEGRRTRNCITRELATWAGLFGETGADRKRRRLARQDAPDTFPPTTIEL